MKQRLIGAIVLILLAVIFLPMLVQGPAPESGVGDIPLRIPAEPKDGIETRELPLAGPGQAPAGGAVGMPAAPAMPEPGQATTAAAGQRPATTAAGDYAVNFGAYATRADADTVAAQLLQSQLPGYVEATTVAGKPAWRVRVGNFATRAEAEAARLRALHVRDDVNAKVVTLDAGTATAPAPAPGASVPANPVATPAAPIAAASPAPPKPAQAAAPVQKPAATAPVTPVPKPTPPAVAPVAKPAATAPAAPAKPAPSSTGFAVQLGAFGSASEATALRDRARAAGFSTFTETVRTDTGTLTRVRVGPVADRAAADALKAQVQARLGVAGMVRPHP